MEQHEPPEHLISFIAASRQLGITPTTLRTRIQSGELQVWRDPLDRRVRLLDVAALERLRASQRVISEESAANAA